MDAGEIASGVIEDGLEEKDEGVEGGGENRLGEREKSLKVRRLTLGNWSDGIRDMNTAGQDRPTIVPCWRDLV